jgi:hypothetical protein
MIHKMTPGLEGEGAVGVGGDAEGRGKGSDESRKIGFHFDVLRK